MGLSVDEPSLDHLMGLQGAWSPQEVTVLAWLRKFFEVQKATEVWPWNNQVRAWTFAHSLQLTHHDVVLAAVPR